MAKKEEVNTAIDEINQILSESSASNKSRSDQEVEMGAKGRIIPNGHPELPDTLSAPILQHDVPTPQSYNIHKSNASLLNSMMEIANEVYKFSDNKSNPDIPSQSADNKINIQKNQNIDTKFDKQINLNEGSIYAKNFTWGHNTYENLESGRNYNNLGIALKGSKISATYTMGEDQNQSITDLEFNKVVNRLYESHKKYHEKREAQQFLRYEREMKNVFQRPHILQKSKELAKNKCRDPIYSKTRIQHEIASKRNKISKIKEQVETEKYEKELVKDNEFKAKKSYLRKQDPYANTVRSLHRAFIFDEEEQKIKHYSIAKKKVLLPTTEEKEIEMCCSFHPVTDRKSNKLCEKQSERVYGRKVEDRLLKMHSVTQQKLVSKQAARQPTFQPHLNINKKNNSPLESRKDSNVFGGLGRIGPPTSEKIIKKFKLDKRLVNMEIQEKLKIDFHNESLPTTLPTTAKKSTLDSPNTQLNFFHLLESTKSEHKGQFILREMSPENEEKPEEEEPFEMEDVRLLLKYSQDINAKYKGKERSKKNIYDNNLIKPVGKNNKFINPRERENNEILGEGLVLDMESPPRKEDNQKFIVMRNEGDESLFSCERSAIDSFRDSIQELKL